MRFDILMMMAGLASASPIKFKRDQIVEYNVTTTTFINGTVHHGSPISNNETVSDLNLQDKSLGLWMFSSGSNACETTNKLHYGGAHPASIEYTVTDYYDKKYYQLMWKFSAEKFSSNDKMPSISFQNTDGYDIKTTQTKGSSDFSVQWYAKDWEQFKTYPLSLDVTYGDNYTIRYSRSCDGDKSRRCEMIQFPLNPPEC
ncbi:hypothetical protein DASC09_057490 [Saccharomycopsis crataegensis]|uniref:Secreted protein n=1 Tax=Saccharomycopsis crataegensis TaxID=43959 RepID=A0AAV5QTY9_9ASCO|nr:hypothetical protein DASC09_057490 [Saccharomycopsis crataegensis]